MSILFSWLFLIAFVPSFFLASLPSFVTAKGNNNYNGDFTLFSDGQPPTTGGEMFPSMASWGNFSAQYEPTHAPLTAGNSTLEDLFPELRGH